MELHFPSRPTFICSLKHTELTVHVCSRIEVNLIRDWVSLAKTLNRDVRIAIWITEDSQRKRLPKIQVELASLGVGIYITGSPVTRLREAADQNTPSGLPDLASRRLPVRRALGQAYEHFEASRWREGFDESCRTLEQSARPYVMAAIRSGRLKVYSDNGKVLALTPAKVERQTLGQLAHTIGNAQPLNSIDTLIHQALTKINADRVRLTHANNSAATERSLRKNVGLHMHVILRAMDALTK